MLMLSHDLEEMVREYKENRSPELLEKILQLMEPLIKYWSHTQCYLPWEKEDLLQISRIAVAGALERFDPLRGIRFKTFAYKTVTGKILNYYRDNTWRVTIPRRYRELSTYINKIDNEVYQKTGKRMSSEEMANHLNITEEQLAKVIHARQAALTTSLSDQIEGEDGKSEIINIIGREDNNLQSIESRQDLAKAMESLEEIKKQVIFMRFYQDMTQVNVANELGISQMQVSRLERVALRELKKHLSTG